MPRSARYCIAALACIAHAGIAPAGMQSARAQQSSAATPLSHAALAECLRLEQDARSLHQRHARERARFEAEGAQIDSQRAALDMAREQTDRSDPAAVVRYNAAASTFDARVNEHNASLAGVEATEAAQKALAQDYNARCGGKSYRPDDLKAQ